MKYKIIIFTKSPEKNFSKTRLLKYLGEDTVLSISEYLLNKTYNSCKDFDISMHYLGNVDNLSAFPCEKIEQTGHDIGERMYNSIIKELAKGYEKVILIGSDFDNIPKSIFNEGFNYLDEHDVIIVPSNDGGFGLIGSKSPVKSLITTNYSSSNVVNSLTASLDEEGLSYKIYNSLHDIDTIEDLISSITKSNNISIIGHGEYNLNFKYDNSVFRINLGSQLGLGDKQIIYEYNTLKCLSGTNVVPKVYECKVDNPLLPCGYLTMEFIDGRPLDYSTDMHIAARLLSTIHNAPINSNHFFEYENPFQAMIDECTNLFNKYKNYSNKNQNLEYMVENLFKDLIPYCKNYKISNKCIINTELNNKNFIINSNNSRIIDWEKAIIGEAEQDLGHFLSPTTTNWKTDVILTYKEINNFLTSYKSYRDIDIDKVYLYIKFNILRGICWCSMAKVEYDGVRQLKNSDTINKINEYLSPSYIEKLLKLFWR